MPYSTQADLATDGTFIRRVECAIVDAAIDIQNEGNAVANHSYRAIYAHDVLHDSLLHARQMALGVVADGTTNAGATDAELKSRVAAIWNAYAIDDGSV